MKRSSVPTAVLVAAAALVALLVYGVVQEQRGVGDKALDRAVLAGKLPMAPELNLVRPSVDGKSQRTLGSLKGKVVVVNFFASWCPPCREEAPVLNAAQKSLEASGDGTIVGVTYHDAADASLGFAKSSGFTFPLMRDPGDKLFDAFGNRGLPETIVLDRQGRIADLSRGTVDKAFLDQAIAKAKAA